jgi:ankyrin repeat protein
MEYFMNLIKSISLALIALAVSQAGLAMEKEVPATAVEHIPTIEEAERAIFADDLQIVKDFIKSGADVNQYPASGQTLLYTACGFNRIEIVKELIEHGANPDLPEQWFSGHTSLHWAVSLGYDEIIRILLENGADLNCKNKSGQTPLDVAQDCTLHQERVQMLLEEIERRKEIR